MLPTNIDGNSQLRHFDWRGSIQILHQPDIDRDSQLRHYDRAYAFDGCSSLTSIEIPNSVTSILYSAFSCCTSLTSIEIPNSVTSIGEYAFSGCTGLPVVNNIRYADTYLVSAVDKTLSTYSIKEGTRFIGSGAFGECSSLASVEIPNSVTSIGGSAFSGCASLTSIVIPYSVTSIGNYAYNGCTSLTSVEIPNSVIWIGSDAFSGCTSLTSVEIPNSVTWIGSDAFSGCDNLPIENGIRYAGTYLVKAIEKERSYTIKEGTRWIGSEAFKDCTLMSSVEIPSTVIDIQYEAFRGCSKLTSIELTDAVTNIGTSAFNGCSNLTEVEIPESVANIGGDAFSNCSNLEKVCFNAVDCDDWSGALFRNCTKLKELIFGEGVKTIPAYAFGYVKTVNSIEIPNSVVTIGQWAFYECTGLESLTLGNSVTTIGYEAFSYCVKIPSLIIPASVTKISDNAFYGCYNIKTATFGCNGNLAKSIPTYSLTEITLTEDVDNFEDFPFKNCGKLTTLYSFAENPPTLTDSQFTDNQYDNLAVHVPTDALSTYSSAPVWKLFLNINGDLTGIETPSIKPFAEGRTYNMQGAEVNDSYKGIVIKNGKKYLKK